MPRRSTRPPSEPATASSRLRTETIATRVSFTWLGVRKTLTTEQKARAADGFDAEARYLSASKKLLDTQHPRFRAVTALRGQVLSHWKHRTLPYPEPGLRLIRQSSLDDFDRQMREYRDQLSELVAALDEHYAELRNDSRERLGQLFNPTDYPVSLREEFGVTWDYPSTEPPTYLQELHPELYQQECERVKARFDEAVELAEQMFFDELSKLVTHLTERLSGQEDGKPKVFRDSAVENLTEFFERFQSLSLRSDGDLEALVARARNILKGVSPQDLRDSASRRQDIAGRMASVQATLDGLLVDRPRRSIIRPQSVRTEEP